VQEELLLQQGLYQHPVSVELTAAKLRLEQLLPRLAD
jgi:hypothetical protein